MKSRSGSERRSGSGVVSNLVRTVLAGRACHANKLTVSLLNYRFVRWHGRAGGLVARPARLQHFLDAREELSSVRFVVWHRADSEQVLQLRVVLRDLHCGPASPRFQ